ncbi:MAG TPA: hypothetical protein VK796_02695 [Cytophaga sp.]|jgi:hypothetical protein|nr:hypothetical protein [Cytophaga sp.]
MKNIKINAVLFILLTLFFWVFIFATLIAAAAEDEGTLGNCPIWMLFARLFYILRFPTHTLLWEFINGVTFLPALMLNGLFYAFITERIISFLRNKRLRA